MKDEFNNRLGMAKTVLTTLELAAHVAIWQGQPPLVFTTKVGLLRAKVVELQKLMSDQEAVITGFSTVKDSRELDLEDLAQEIGSALSGYFDDHDHAELSGAVDFSISDWRRLREESLVARAQVVEAKLTDALAADAAGLIPYDLDAADLTGLTEAIGSYDDVIKSPQAAISTRAGLTKVVRPRFRELNVILAGMDKLALRFRKTTEGRQFVDAYLAARIVRDLGHGPSDTPPVTP